MAELLPRQVLPPDLKVLPDLKELLARKARKEFPERRGRLAQADHQDQQVHQEVMVQLVRRDPKDCKERKALLASQK